VRALYAQLLLRRGALLLIDDRDEDDLGLDDDERRTSAEWADLFDIEIVRPDGWDAADFEHDFTSSSYRARSSSTAPSAASPAPSAARDAVRSVWIERTRSAR